MGRQKRLAVAVAAMTLAALAAGCSGSTSARPAASATALREPWIPPMGTIGMTGTGMPSSIASEAVFAREAGVTPGIISYYSGWQEPFRSAFAAQAHRIGAVVLVDMDSTGSELAGIAAGKYDAYLRRFGQEIQAAGAPVIVSFDHEANGTWFDYGYGHVKPAAFAAAFRHVHDVIDSETNRATWAWVVNIPAGKRTEPLGPLYPGSAYIDLVGVDGYDWSGTLTFSREFGAGLTQAREAAPGKPVFIAETAVAPGPNAAAQVDGLFAGVKAYSVRGFLWFDVSRKGVKGSQDQHDWRIEDDPAALAAFRAAVRAYTRTKEHS